MSMHTDVVVYTRHRSAQVAAALLAWGNPGGRASDFAVVSPDGPGMAGDVAAVVGRANMLNDLAGLLAAVAAAVKHDGWDSWDPCAVVTSHEGSDGAPHVHRLDADGTWASTGGF